VEFFQIKDCDELARSSRQTSHQIPHNHQLDKKKRGAATWSPRFYQYRSTLFAASSKLTLASSLLHGDFLRALAELLMPDLHRVGSGGHIGQLKLPELSVTQNKDSVCHHPAMHPTMHIAFDFDGFGFIDLNFEGFLELRLSVVKRAVDLAVRMNVVENPIRVQDFNRRAGRERHHMGIYSQRFGQGDLLVSIFLPFGYP